MMMMMMMMMIQPERKRVCTYRKCHEFVVTRAVLMWRVCIPLWQSISPKRVNMFVQSSYANSSDAAVKSGHHWLTYSGDLQLNLGDSSKPTYKLSSSLRKLLKLWSVITNIVTYTYTTQQQLFFVLEIAPQHKPDSRATRARTAATIREQRCLLPAPPHCSASSISRGTPSSRQWSSSPWTILRGSRCAPLMIFASG